MDLFMGSTCYTYFLATWCSACSYWSMSALHVLEAGFNPSDILAAALTWRNLTSGIRKAAD